MKIMRALRKERKVTMKQLGDAIGASESSISMYELGKRQPDPETLIKIADYLDVSVDYLLGRTDVQSMPSADEFTTIAAHHEGEWTEEDLQEIEDFKDYIRSKKAKEKEKENPK